MRGENGTVGTGEARRSACSEAKTLMPKHLPITSSIALDESEISISFIRAPGPGGQNVNKVSTAAQLRFDLRHASLPEGLKQRAAVLAGSRLTQDGEIVITAARFRTQSLNRDDAVARLVELLREAATPPKPRRPTRPTLASKTRRLEGKTRRSGVKRLRSGRPSDE